MSISKKDFVEIAYRLNQTLKHCRPMDRAGVLQACAAVANACSKLNASFDRDRFYEACGVTEEDRK